MKRDGAPHAQGDLAHEDRDQGDRRGQDRSGSSGAADEEGGDGRQEGDHGDDAAERSVEGQHVVMTAEKPSGEGDLSEHQNRQECGGDAQGQQTVA
ncbi:hypothetical protein O1L60_38725 [Streptomyces diastatochromogenes]|nr:hypothetical protein [Streptomyces diastatochromogenes]